MQIRIRIEKDGTVRSLYNEAYDFTAHGDIAIRRVSRVEPRADGKWEADMSLLGSTHEGVILGPFDKRSQALQAEVDYIQQRQFKTPVGN